LNIYDTLLLRNIIETYVAQTKYK